MSVIRTWSDVEAAVARLPRAGTATFTARAARRVLPAIAALEARYGREAWEWLNAADTAVRVVEAFARGEAVSRFTLSVAAELARTAAAATAEAARVKGPSPLFEDAELAYAAAAFAADAVRSPSDARAASLAMQAARSAAGGGAVPREQLTDLERLLQQQDPGPLWPYGEPEGWAATWESFSQHAAVLPRFIA